MGADVEWDSETQTATATLDNTVVTFSIDNINAEVNKTSATMDVPARLINGKQWYLCVSFQKIWDMT